MRIRAVESRRLASRRFEDNIALVDVSSRKLHSLNPAAAVLWKPITAGATIEELAEILRATYDLQIDCARRDVEAFVKVLVEEELVTVESPTKPEASPGDEPQGRTG